jgi:hypothetical protein
MVKKAVQQGRSERGGDAYSVSYAEALSDARTTLADFFNILLDIQHNPRIPPGSSLAHIIEMLGHTLDISPQFLCRWINWRTKQRCL